jgi:hypothetical protein
MFNLGSERFPLRKKVQASSLTAFCDLLRETF